MLAFDSVQVAKKVWGQMTFFRERKVDLLIYLNTHSLVVSFEGKFIIQTFCTYVNWMLSSFGELSKPFCCGTVCVFLLLYHFEPFIIELVYVQTTLACYLTENDHCSYVVLIASLRQSSFFAEIFFDLLLIIQELNYEMTD